MSSLAATQADGYYLPVEYYESGAYKKKSKNQWNDQQNGKKTPSGPPVVRFELPYTGTCVGCGHFILRGTRYNAEKSKAGNYFTTTIWEFKIKCRNCCKQIFILRTNPKEQSFDYISGITKQKRHLEPTTAPSQARGGRGGGEGNSSEEEQDAIALVQLEKAAKGERKFMTERDQLEAMQKSSTQLYLNDASHNSIVRSKFRVERKDRKKRRKDAEALGYRDGISMLDATLEDVVEAKEVTFGDRHASERKSFSKARASSIFNSSSSKKKRKTKQSTTSNQKKSRSRKGGDPIRPDEVTSTSTSRIKSHNNKSHEEMPPSSKKAPPPPPPPKKKKILVVGKMKTAPTTTTKEECTSGLGALMDYGSDSS